MWEGCHDIVTGEEGKWQRDVTRSNSYVVPYNVVVADNKTVLATSFAR